MVENSPWRDWKRAAAVTTVVLMVASLYVLAAGAILALSRVLGYLLIALFFTVILTPAVDFLHHRLNIRRGVGTVLVFVLGLALLSSMMYSFIRPIVDQGQKLVDDFPTLVEDAEKGEGPVGRLVKRYDLQDWVTENKDTFSDRFRNLGSPALDVVKSFFNGLFAALTVLVLSFLMILQAPNMSKVALDILPEHSRERVRRIAGDAAGAVSGYMTGNLLISVVAGVVAYIFLKIAGVPYAEVLALWVAFADLIPLVGATLGAVPTVAVAFLNSNTKGIVTVVFFVLYQQFENNVLQVTVMSRTVNINPLGVLVSVLVGVELFGVLGAILAIPAAGVIQVIIRDIWDEHRGQFKEEPTIGADEIPMSET